MPHSFRKKNTERCVASVRGGLFQDQHVVALGILICCALMPTLAMKHPQIKTRARV